MSYKVEILETTNKLEISSSVNEQAPVIEILQNGTPSLNVVHDVALLPSDFNNNTENIIKTFLKSGYGVSLFPSGDYFIVQTSGLQPVGDYSLNGHNHSSLDITNFNTSVSGLLPVKNIVSGSGISVSNNDSIFTVAVTGQFGLTAEQVDDRVNNLLVSGSGISLSYDDANDRLTISTIGLQPSGNYSVVGHSHIVNDITDLQSILDNKAASIHTHSAESIVSGTLDFHRLPFTVTYPVRAVHVGGMISFNSYSYIISPAYYWNGTYGDLQTLATMEFPATSVYVDVSRSVTKYLTDYPGRVFTYASLEVVLIDASNRIVGWGTTASNPATNPSNGTAGTSMTIPLLSFPSVSNSWVIGGLPTSGTNTVDILPISSYKKVASRWLDIEKYDWNNVVNPPPTYIPSSHTHGNITNLGSIGSQSGQILITSTSGLITTTQNIASSQISNFNSSVSGLLPVKDIIGGNNITISNNSGQFTVAVTGQLGLTAEQVDDRVAGLLVAGNHVNLNYNDNNDILTVSVTGVQPSGNYSIVGHGHAINDVAGLQIALDNKQPSGVYASGVHYHSTSDITNFNSSVSGLLTPYAQLNSPNFSGTPTVPTAVSGSNNNQIANTQFVRSEISNLIGSAPSTLDTLNELAIALGNDPNFATTVTNNLAGKANLTGAIFSGSVSAPTGNFNSLTQNSLPVSVSGHQHIYSDITNFASGVSDSLTTTLLAGTFINLNYDNTLDTLTISASGLQPSGNYSVVGHSHVATDITNFNSSVSGLLPTVTNSGSNRLVTSTGSSTGLSAQSNLTFNGSLLEVTGSGSFSNNVVASGFVRNGGTANQFLKADGSVDNNSYYLNSNPSGYTTNIGTVTNVSALNIGTSGNDISSSVSNASTTPVITINIPSASSNNRGVLNSADWNTFNNKQPSGNYSLVGHNHTVSQIIDAGTASYKNIPSSGNALSGEVVLGSDTRLVNERIPIDASVTTSKLANGSVTASKIAAYQDFSAARFTATASFGNSKCFAVNLGIGNGDVFLVDWDGQITSGKWMGTKIGVAYGGTNATTASEALINLGAANVSHSHGNISNSGAIGSTSGLLVTTGQSGILTTSSGISSSYINNFNTSVSGLLPITDITGNSGIIVDKSGTSYNVSASGLAYLSGANFTGNISSPSGSFSGIKTNLGSLNNPGISFSDSPSKIYKTNDGLAISANGNTLAMEVADGGTVCYENLYAYGNLRVNQGSANSLSINSNNDLDTGFSFPADMFGGNAGVIDAYSFRNHAFRISDGGNFSVGTTVPSGRFHVSGVSNFSGPIFASSGNFNSNLRVNNIPVSVSGHNHSVSDVTNLQSSLDLKANVTSPNFSGIPTVPTATSGTNTNQIASTSFVRSEISNLVGSAPSTLDTLNELATALGNDPNFATTVTNNLAGKANLTGATFTGNISAPSGNFVNKLTVNNIDVSVSGHTHVSSNITDFNTSVSGLLPVRNILASGPVTVANVSGVYTINATGLQPVGNYSLVGHSHLSNDITDINGNKGDISVSNSGLNWTINNNSISYGKIQNVSSTDRLLGRASAGSGVVEEIVCTSFARTLLDDTSASVSRSTLGLGSLAVQDNNNVNIIGGYINGITTQDIAPALDRISLTKNNIKKSIYFININTTNNIGVYNITAQNDNEILTESNFNITTEYYGVRQFAVPVNAVWQYKISFNVINTSDNLSASFNIRGVIKNNGSSTTFIGSNILESWQDSGMESVSLTVGVNNGLEIETISGLSNKQLKWGGVLEIVELNNN